MDEKEDGGILWRTELSLLTLLKIMYPNDNVTIHVSNNERMHLQVGLAIKCLSDDTLNRTVNLLDSGQGIIIRLEVEQ